jgi:Tol biopolymer transport system component
MNHRFRLFAICITAVIGYRVARVAAAPFQSDTTADRQTSNSLWDATKTRGQNRTIDFTVNEGTFESVDISPDGRWILFDLLGHIYRIPSAGGNAMCLTQATGAALNYHPRYSPDGTKIAFVSDRLGQSNLWVMNADGSDPQPIFIDHDSRIRQPVWMPDARSIVAVRAFPTVTDWELHRTTLWQFFLDRRQPRELLASNESQYYWPSLSPDGRYLYFYISSVMRPLDNLTEGQQIQRLELATGQVRDITTPKHPALFRGAEVVSFAPEISPDGRWLAFGRRIPGGMIEFRGHTYNVRTALWLRDLQNGAERLVMDPIESDATQGNADRHMKVIPGYRWAKDGRSIIIPQGGKIRRLWLDSSRVETIAFSAHVHREISETVRSHVHITDEPFEVKFLRWPASSPDGHKLVFEAVGRLWLMDLPDGTPKPLTPDSFHAFELTPAWSPDGRWIAFATWDDIERGQLWRVPATGGDPQRLTVEAGEYIYPVWSRDGKYLVFTQGTGATARGEEWDANLWWELACVPSAGGATKVITETDQIVQASIGPDSRIYYPAELPERDLLTPARHGETPTNRWMLFSTSVDGRDRRKHFVVFGESAVLSPDGRRIAFTDRLELYLTTANRVARSKDLGQNALELQRLTRQGGLYPRWRDKNTLEFMSGNRYYVYDASAGTTRTYRIHLQISRDIPKGTIAFSGARIITSENQRVIERGTILVRGSRIVCVGDCDVSLADRILDLSGKTVIPGLVDMHAHHLAGSPGGIPSHRQKSARYLAYGVTTALDPYAPSDPAFPIAQLIDAGRIVGPRTFTTGDAIAGYGPTSDIHTYQDAKDLVLRQVEWGAVSIKDYEQPSRIEQQMLAQAAREAGVTLTAEGEDLFRDLGFIVDGHPGWEHNLPYTPLYADATTFFGQAHVEYSATLNVSSPQLRGQEYQMVHSELWGDPKQQAFVPWRELAQSRYYVVRPLSEYAFPILAEGLADIVHAGGRGAVGGHGEWQGIDAQWDLWSGASALQPIEELEVATWQGASFIGADKDIGSVKVGKLADLVVLNSNPLEDIKNTRDIRYVMKGGILYDGDSLDEVWPLRKPYGPRPWVNKAALQSDTRPIDYWDRR